MKQEPVAWMMVRDGEFFDAIHPEEHTRHEGDYTVPLYTAPRELSDEEVVFTANDVNVLRNAIENYVCTLKSELTEEQRVFKGYEKCSNVNAIVSELEDAERASEILNKASEK